MAKNFNGAISPEIIGYARKHLTSQINTLQTQLADLNRAYPQDGVGTETGYTGAVTTNVPNVSAGTTVRKRTMSPAARKRISEMMKKRWATRRNAGKATRKAAKGAGRPKATRSTKRAATP